jgi:predicted flap endonuclease-1-like 5' DNA nuclease
VNILDVEGIGPAFADKLGAVGITTTDDLLARGARPRGRASIAEATGISAKLILTWVNHVDLMRVDGVGPQYSDLLELAGVDSPLELARRNPTNLAATFAEIDAARPNEVRRVPSEAVVAGWVDSAKTLARAVWHEDGPASEDASSGSAPVAVAEAPAAVEAAVAEAPAAVAEAPAEAPAAVAEAEPEAPIAEAVVAEHEPAAAAEPEPAAEPIAAAEPEPEPAAEPEPMAPAAPAAPAPAAPRPLASSAPAPERLGLWARIKRAIGLG